MNRRDFLRSIAATPFILGGMCDLALAGERSIPKPDKKACDVYDALRNKKLAEFDLIGPKVTKEEGTEYDVVRVERVLNTQDYQYTAAALTHMSKDMPGMMILGEGGLEIYRRTKGPSIKTSLIYVADDNLDGVVDKGMTRRTGRVIAPSDRKWNEICEEYGFGSAGSEKYKELFQRVYTFSLDDLAKHLGM